MVDRAGQFHRRNLLAIGTLSAAAYMGAGVAASGLKLMTSIASPDLGPMQAPLPRAVPTRAALANYHAFRTRFITPDGRVVDTGNGRVSHTEGQGWGMLMAVAFDDPATFDQLYAWTLRSLRRPSDRLHAWRYQPEAEIRVADPNNATDGDLYIAAALARAARHWNRPSLAEDAAAIGQDILRLLVRQAGHRLVLLPGAAGFEKEGGIIVNPSYYAFSMMRDVAALVPSPSWSRLHDDGLALIEQGRFGPMALPPDWLRIDRKSGELSPAPGWPPRFSYDAIRIPLNLAWAGLYAPGMANAFRRYWTERQDASPAWADLASGAVAPYPAEAGTRAVADLALRAGRADIASREGGALPQVDAATDYYSAALIVLADIADSERLGAR